MGKFTTNNEGQSAVETAGVCQFAVLENNFAEIKECKADQNKQNKHGDSALHWAVRLNNLEMLSMLIQQDAKKDLQTNKGKTALFIAAEEGCLEAARILIAADADLEIKNQKGHTALDVAVQNNNLAIIEFLVAEGADVDQGAIHVAASYGRLKPKPILLKKMRADVRRFMRLFGILHFSRCCFKRATK